MVKNSQNPSRGDMDRSRPFPNGLDLSLGRARYTKYPFQRAFAQQNKYVGRSMILWLRSGEAAALRVGIITSKKVSLRANKRNRARRVLRECFRHTRPYLRGDVDLILVARRSLLTRSYHSIRAELIQLCNQAGLLTPTAKEQLLNELDLAVRMRKSFIFIIKIYQKRSAPGWQSL